MAWKLGPGLCSWQLSSSQVAMMLVAADYVRLRRWETPAGVDLELVPQDDDGMSLHHPLALRGENEVDLDG